MSEKAPLISVTIASYNYEKYIPKMLDSVAAQTFRDFELVITDDGSTDNAVGVIESFIEAHPEMEIRLYKNSHLGLCGNRNSALMHARGRYIMFCDADDFLEPDCLELLAEKALLSDPDRVVSYVRDVDRSGKELQIEEQWGSIKSRWMVNLHHGSLYKRSLFMDHNIRFVEAAGGDDFMISTIYNSYAKTAEFVEKPLYNWVVHEDSASGAKKEITSYTGLNMITCIVEPMKEVKERLAGRAEDYALFVYQMIRYYYFCIFHCYRYVKVRETFADYDKMRACIREIEPKYLKNPWITLKEPSPARLYAKRIIFFSALLEKLHLMKPALLFYHILSGFHYFNT